MRLDFDNRGGISRIYAIPAGNISYIRENWGFGTVTPELTTTQGIIEIPFYAGQTYSFHEEHSIGDNGDCYNVNITGVIPSQMIAPATVDILRYGEWLVVHRDARGRIRLSGTKLIPLRFSSTSETGTSPHELNGEAFSFSATESVTSPDCTISGFGNL